MKKILLVCVVFFMVQMVVAQNHLTIRLDVNSSTVNNGGQEFGTKIGSVLTPGISVGLLREGAKWGYLCDIGYSQAGFKETGKNYNATIRYSNIDFDLLGLQYAFLDDWAKIRPIIQARFGLRIILPSAKVTVNGNDADLDLDNSLDLPLSIGGGVMTKHWMGVVSYGVGLLKYGLGETVSGLQQRSLQLSVIYLF